MKKFLKSIKIKCKGYVQSVKHFYWYPVVVTSKQTIKKKNATVLIIRLIGFKWLVGMRIIIRSK